MDVRDGPSSKCVALFQAPALLSLSTIILWIALQQWLTSCGLCFDPRQDDLLKAFDVAKDIIDREPTISVTTWKTASSLWHRVASSMQTHSRDRRRVLHLSLRLITIYRRDVVFQQKINEIREKSVNHQKEKDNSGYSGAATISSGQWNPFLVDLPGSSTSAPDE